MVIADWSQSWEMLRKTPKINRRLSHLTKTLLDE
jgi:hypothetical protein